MKFLTGISTATINKLKSKNFRSENSESLANFGGYNFETLRIDEFYSETSISHVNTLYGKCLKFKPPYTEKLMAPFGRQAGLSLVISFNETDWTSGWNHLLKGRSRDRPPK